MSLIAKMLRGMFSWFMPALGFVLAFGISLSPWFVDRLDRAFDSTERVDAHIDSCVARRSGVLRENTIRCQFSYVWNGQSFTSESIAWRSDSALDAARGLDAALADQRAKPLRQTVFRARSPQRAHLVDERWLVMPSLGLLLFFGVVASLALIIYLEPSATVYRRADLLLDSQTGELVEINGKRRTRMRWRAALKKFTCLLILASCFYALSNRAGNAVLMMGMGHLQPVPAQLSGCMHRLHGGYRGHDQIDCRIDYGFDGQTFHGQAESLDFRNFPTQARMDDAVARIHSGTSTVTAWVDPQQPGYAIAFISDDWWVPASWGLWELELWLVALAALLFLCVPSQLRKAAHPGRS